MQWGLLLLSALPCWFEPAVRNGPAKRWLTQIGAKKKARKQARMLSCLIYFFGPFSIYYILHDYVIPQAMPHAIPQTHSSFYPHNGWDKNRKRKVPCINSVRFTQLWSNILSFENIFFSKPYENISSEVGIVRYFSFTLYMQFILHWFY